jgi:hypothetical protein
MEFLDNCKFKDNGVANNAAGKSLLLLAVGDCE